MVNKRPYHYVFFCARHLRILQNTKRIPVLFRKCSFVNRLRRLHTQLLLQLLDARLTGQFILPVFFKRIDAGRVGFPAPRQNLLFPADLPQDGLLFVFQLHTLLSFRKVKVQRFKMRVDRPKRNAFIVSSLMPCDSVQRPCK